MCNLRPPAITCGFIALAISFPAMCASIDWTGCSVPNFGEDRSKAIAACTAVLNRADLTNAERARALLIRGRAEHRAKKIDAAILDYDEAITLAPEDPEPLAFRASAAFFKRDLPGAFAFDERALKLNQDYPMALDTMGVVQETAGNYAMAKFAYDKAIALDPSNVGARFHRFEYWKSIGAGPQALKELEDLLASNAPGLDLDFLDFRGKEMSYRAMVRLQRAALFGSLGRFPDAIKAFDEFVQTDPGAISFGQRGWFYIDRSQYDLAKADIEKALSYDPDFFLLHGLQGLIFTHAGDYEHAVTSFTRALELGPDQTGESYWWRALAERALHRTEAAQKDALRAFSTDPTFLRTKLKMFQERGYWQPPQSETDLGIAVHDAVVACMADEECW